MIKYIFFASLVNIYGFEGSSINNNFRIISNQFVYPTTFSGNLIQFSTKRTKMFCLSACSSSINCYTAFFQNHQSINNCFLYNRYFNLSDLVPKSSSEVFEKLAQSSLNASNFQFFSITSLA